MRVHIQSMERVKIHGLSVEKNPVYIAAASKLFNEQHRSKGDTATYLNTIQTIPAWCMAMGESELMTILKMELKSRSYDSGCGIPPYVVTEWIIPFLWPVLRRYMNISIIKMNNTVCGAEKVQLIRVFFRTLVQFSGVINLMGSYGLKRLIGLKCIEFCGEGYIFPIVLLKKIFPYLVSKHCYPIIDTRAKAYKADTEWVMYDSLFGPAWECIQAKIIDLNAAGL